MHPEVEAVVEFFAQEGLHQIQASDDLDVLVPVADLAHRGDQIGPKLRGPRPRQVGVAAGSHILRNRIEQGGDLAVLTAFLVGPVCGEHVIGSTTEKECVRALVRGTDLRSGHRVEQGCLPAAERESFRVLLGAAGRLPDEVERGEQFDLDEAHAPTSPS